MTCDVIYQPVVTVIPVKPVVDGRIIILSSDNSFKIQKSRCFVAVAQLASPKSVYVSDVRYARNRYLTIIYFIIVVGEHICTHVRTPNNSTNPCTRYFAVGDHNCRTLEYDWRIIVNIGAYIIIIIIIDVRNTCEKNHCRPSHTNNIKPVGTSTYLI